MLTMSKSISWTRIMSYVAENQMKMAEEARIQYEMAKRAKDVTDLDAWT